MTQSVLQRIPPGARRESLVDALCAELEIAIRQREESVAELDRLQSERQKEADCLAAEIEALIQSRDQAMAEIEEARAMSHEELAAARAECERAIRERDELLRRIPEADAPHKKPLKSLRSQKAATPKPAAATALQEERDAYKSAADKLLGERTQALKERDKIAAQLASEQKAHAEQLKAWGRQSEEAAAQLQKVRAGSPKEEPEKKLRALREERDALIAERDEITVQMARLGEDHRRAFHAVAQERDEAVGKHQRISEDLALAGEQHAREIQAMAAERDQLTAEFARTREEQGRIVTALAAEKEQLSAERIGLATELERARAAFTEQVAALEGERDGLLARQAMAAESATAGEQQNGDTEKLNAHHDDLTKDRIRLGAEFARFREMHARQVETLTNERDGFMNARNELREYLEVLTDGHRREFDALRQQLGAVLNERREMLAMVERDRLSSRQQFELFTEERDTLVRERDGAVSELAHERQRLGQQVDVRERECENLAAQRSALLTQLNQLREAQKHQNDLFDNERQILIAQRDIMSAKLDHALKSLGMDRVTLLQKKLDADGRLTTAANVHRQEVEAIAQARDAALQERDSAVAELNPLRIFRQREVAVLGTLASSKYVALDTADHDLGGRRPVRDAVIERKVEMKVCLGEEMSEAANAEFLEEIRHLGRLQHPNIPAVYDAGLDENGRVYYTIRHVAGVTLGDVLDQLEHGRINTLLHFTLKRLLGIFHKVCDAVAFAHAHGMAHGNLSPEHIILGEFGDVSVTRWSLRRKAGPAATSEADIQDDIVALGRMLYEISTLESPPDSGVVRQESAAHKKAAANRHRTAARTLSNYWGADTNLKTLVSVARRALDPRAPDQFQTAREFQIQVDAFKDSFEDPLRLTLRRLLRHWMLSHKAAAAVVLALLVLAAGVLGVGARQKYLEYRARQIEIKELIQRIMGPPVRSEN